MLFLARQQVNFWEVVGSMFCVQFRCYYLVRFQRNNATILALILLYKINWHQFCCCLLLSCLDRWTGFFLAPYHRLLFGFRVVLLESSFVTHNDFVEDTWYILYFWTYLEKLMRISFERHLKCEESIEKTFFAYLRWRSNIRDTILGSKSSLLATISWVNVGSTSIRIIPRRFWAIFMLSVIQGKMSWMESFKPLWHSN